MPRKIVDKTSFLGGEAGALLEGRSDLAQFQLGLSPGENFINLKGGGVTRRPGSRYVKTTQGNKPARLIPFVVSYDDGADIYVVEIALASSTSLTFRVIRVSDNTVYTPTGSPLTVADSIDLNEIQFAQSAEFLFLVHKSFTPQLLYRTSASGASPTFTLEPYIGYTTSSRALAYSVPYRDPNISAITLTADNAASGAGRTITASAAFFNAGHVGTYFGVDADADADYEGAFLVTGFTSSTVVTATILDPWADTAVLASGALPPPWREGAWSTYRGFPRTVTFYNQRLVFGGNTSQPDTFWMSQVSDYFQMSTDPSDTDIDGPLSFTLASDKLNQIRWIVGGKRLTIGTSSSEWVGTVTNDGTNLFVQFDEETNHGSAPVQPSKFAYTIPFVQRGGQTIREMAFDFDSDSYQATDLNLFATHVGTASGRFINSNNISITQVAYQESPFGVLWVLDSVGRLKGMTRDRQQQIASWHSHALGGFISEFALTGLAGADYPPKVISICSVPAPNGKLDRLWLCVQREVNGTINTHIEYLDDIKTHPYVEASTASNSGIKVFLDCATVSRNESTPATLWTGFTRFSSSNAYVVAQAIGGEVNYCGLLAVNASGEITLPSAATRVVVGLHADAKLRLLPLEGGDEPKLHMQGVKRGDRAFVRMHETFGLKVGKNRIPRKTGWEDNETFEPIPFDSSTTPTLPTFTGVKEVGLPTDNDTDGSFALAMEDPWPCTILSICTRVFANEV